MAFLVFEGLDGSGKSTLIRGLEKHLQGLGLKSLVTREPGGTSLGEEIREMLIRVKGETPVPRAELLLYEAGRAQHVEQVIRPKIHQGYWVLCDRFTYSTLAFQVGGRGLDGQAVGWLNEFATDGLHPEMVVLIDIEVKKSLQRVADRERKMGQKQDRFEQEGMGFHSEVRANYLQQAKADPHRWLVLDGQNSPDILLSQLIQSLEQKGWLASSIK